MSEMVERVAKAVQKRRYELAMEAIGGGRVGIGNDDHACREIASAAIAAMREPTAKQLASATMSAVYADASDADKAFAGTVLELLPPTGHPKARTVIAEIARDYRAMIDAALAEGTEAAQVDGEGSRDGK